MSTRLLLFLCTLTTLSGQNNLLDNRYDEKKKTRIIVSTLTDQLPASGFATIRVKVRNDEKSAVTWKFNFKHTEYNSPRYRPRSSSGRNELTSADSVTCEPGKEKTVDFLVPLLTHFSLSGRHSFRSSSQLNISITASGGLGSNHCDIQGAFEDDWPSILISEGLYLDEKNNLDYEVNTSGYHSGTQFGSMFYPDQMSSDWRAYLGFEHVMMSDKDWLDLDPAARSAILSAVRLGTELSIYSKAGTNFRELQIKTDSPASRSIPHGMGSITLPKWAHQNGFDPTELVNEMRTKYRGATRSELLTHASVTSSNPLMELLGKKSFNIALVVLVLIIFGILVGPVNLFVFAKGGQRHKLFITTPIISVAASLLLLLIILFQDGIGGNGHRAVIMQVYPGENENAAYLTQQQFCRTGVLFGTDFETEKNTWVSPVVIPESRWARVHHKNLGAGSRYEVQAGDNNIKHSGDWFQSRSEYAHHAIGVVSTRGRIELKNQNGAPTVQSTFDFPVSRFFYLSPTGEFWKTDQIDKGQSVTLTPASQHEYTAWMIDTKKSLPAALKPDMQKIMNQPGHYYALTDEAPGIGTFDSIDWKSTTTVVTGPIYQP